MPPPLDQINGLADDERNLLIADSEEDELNGLALRDDLAANGNNSRLEAKQSTGESNHSDNDRYNEDEEEYEIIHAKRNLYYKQNQAPTYLSKVLSYFNMSARPTSRQYGDVTFAPTPFDELHSRSSKLTNSSMFFNILKSNQQDSPQNTYAYRQANSNPFSNNRKAHTFSRPSSENGSTTSGEQGSCCSARVLFILTLCFLTAICSFMFLIKLLDLILEQKEINEQNDSSIRWNESSYIENYQMSSNRDSNRWLVSSSKCHIPQIDPWHESISEYVRLKEPLNCTEILHKHHYKQEPLTYVQNNRLYFTKNALREGSKILCCYRELNRSVENDDDLEPGEKCKNLEKLLLDNNDKQVKNGYKIPIPLIRLECHILNYTNVHSFITHNSEEELALKRVAGERLNQDDFYNVVMVGVDTISRLNGLRQLSETLSYLKEEYETIEFVGYNKVGENTFPNLVPLLTGLKPNQLAETTCWMATNYTDESEKGDDYLDNCKFLWNYYQTAGYLTYFSEDWPKASTFNYLKPGFRSEPTNFYGRPFTLARDKLLYPPVGMGCTSCLLDRPLVEVDLENLKSFLLNHQDMPHFAFHWINCPQHDDLNGASQVDSIIKKFFKDLKEITHDNRTFVLFFSDHGYRWNDFVSTQVGHYESSLPLLTIAAPKKFIELHPDKYENLKSHSAALLTPFDMFKTLIDIRNIGMKHQPKETQKKRAAVTVNVTSIEPTVLINDTEIGDSAVTNSLRLVPTAATTVGQMKLLDGLSYKQDFKILSLLDSHNSTQLDRSCIEAGIPDNYCVCNQFVDVPISTLDVIGAAYYLVYVHMDSRIAKSVDLCHLLDLEKIHKAELFDFEKTRAKRRDKRQTSGEWPPPGSASTTTTPAPQRPKTTASTKTKTANSTPGIADPQTETTRKPLDNQLPNREYNVLLSTSPGSALFQEVIRYYGESIDDCMSEVAEAKKIIDDKTSKFESRRSVVVKMNEKCQFSVRSESMSRLNLYKDQSKCVKSDIELKKICYCNDLLPK